MTAKSIDAYLKRKGSPLAGHGQDFMRAGRIDARLPRLLVAIAGAESSFGAHMSGKFNPFGWGPGIAFPDFATAISTVAAGLQKGYLSQGLTSVAQIGAKYAPSQAANDPTGLNSHWSTNVKEILRQLGAGPLGGPGAPTVDAGAPSVPEGGIDTTGSAQAALASIGAGEKYDPLAQLADLAQDARAAEPAAAEPDAGAATDTKLKPGGGWGGSKNIAYQLTRGLGLTSTSEKRDTKNTASGGVSDHWTGSTTAYARDMGGSVAAMDRAAVKLARQLGVAYKKGQPLVYTTTRRYGKRTYRIQVLYRTMVGGNHFDHIHTGIRLVS